jgi:hypothetical protein
MVNWKAENVYKQSSYIYLFIYLLYYFYESFREYVATYLRMMTGEWMISEL